MEFNINMQMSKHLGAKVLGTTSSEAKAEVARKAGCDEVILYTQKDFEQEVKRITDGKGVNVVYDSVSFLNSVRILLI
jgi:NADPH2:quinone reductase